MFNSALKDNVYNGISTISIEPDNENIDAFIQKFYLYIEGVKIGSYPTYTQSLEVAIEFVNSLK